MTDLSASATWSLLVCGDWSPAGGFDLTLAEAPERLYGDLLPILRSADLAVVNLESPFAALYLKPISKDGVYLRLQEPWVKSLKAVPFHLATLANNHVMDYGAAGLSQTCALLEQNGIQQTGVSQKPDDIGNPWRCQIGSIQLVIINVAEGEEAAADGMRAGANPLDIPAICARIHAEVANDRRIVVIAHAGREHLPVPAPYIRDAYRAMADAGADIVIGHHPHVPQGMERRGKTAIFYSLGNFVMWEDSPMALHRIGLCVKVSFTEHGLLEPEIYPYSIQLGGLARLQGDALERFQFEFDRLSTAIATPGQMEDLWAAYSDRWLEKEGLTELVDSAVTLAGANRTLQALVKSAAARSSGGLIGRLKNRLLWWLHARLGHTVSPAAGDSERQIAAAVLRNRFDTPAHAELYRFALKRTMTGEVGSAPGWAIALLDEWKVLV